MEEEEIVVTRAKLPGFANPSTYLDDPNHHSICIIKSSLYLSFSQPTLNSLLCLISLLCLSIIIWLYKVSGNPVLRR